MSVVLVAAAALIDRDGRVLLAERPAGKPMAGLWEFPGGKVKPEETPEAALIRELQEELGIDTWKSCLAPLSFASHAYPDFHLLMPLFACRKWNGIPAPREGQRLKWVRPADFGAYEMPPADIPLVAVLRDWL
ncbi:(deoxy)nucleoside triphosphate pyrophosphohydrolase [Pikeienuella sp. HZG-20]|uniref:(deoxy)nucleoside triphosphate pyrophosphohydrolase n=1 Tax=Paludibacillus litoralis TaxID=3133267 RepID=UPI0030EF0D37